MVFLTETIAHFGNIYPFQTFRVSGPSGLDQPVRVSGFINCFNQIATARAMNPTTQYQVTPEQ